MQYSSVLRDFKKTACEVFQRSLHKAVRWTKDNPLKISGIAGLCAIVLLGYAEEAIMKNHLLFIGTVLEVTGYLTEAIWGRGGKPQAANAANLLAKKAPAQRMRDLFSIQKCLSFRRHPVESASFQGLVGSVAIAASGLEAFYRHGSFGINETSLILLGLFATIGDIHANCVPQRKNGISPMVKAAACYGVTTLCLGLEAINTMNPALLFATLLGGVSDCAFGSSVRHDNALRRKLGSPALQG